MTSHDSSGCSNSIELSTGQSCGVYSSSSQAAADIVSGFKICLPGIEEPLRVGVVEVLTGDSWKPLQATVSRETLLVLTAQSLF
jgi:hypothetical protein